jgi:hypothetical protein
MRSEFYLAPNVGGIKANTMIPDHEEMALTLEKYKP